MKGTPSAQIALLLGLTFGGAGYASAQEPGAAPAPPLPSAAPPAGEPMSREALEDRVRQLEATVGRLAEMLEHQQAAGAAPAAAPAPAAPGSGATKPPPAAPGQSIGNPPTSARFDSPPPFENHPAKTKFGPGFEIRTEDDEFIFQFHNLTQFEYRGYQQGGQTPVHDTFDIPRQWFMFSGRITKPIGYFVSIANGFDTLSILDVFTDLNFGPKLNARVGRFKTPFTYEFLSDPVQGLAIPERSIFFNNFGQNREVGAMAYGKLFNQKVDYAVGTFNGTRNGFLALEDGKAVSAYVNYRPFGDEEGTLLENLNIGGSVFAQNRDQIPQPTTLRTIVPTTGNAIIGVPFLSFNPNVREHGDTALWDLHLAYYYKSLAVIAEWGSGYQSYALTSNLSNPVPLSVQSYYVQASYLITGETRNSLGVVQPLRPFSLKPGSSGPGAIEPYARYESLRLGNEVFTRNLSDPALWTNDVQMTWVGMNWHLNRYLKMSFGWNHAMFGTPVQFAPNRFQLNADMFLARVQLYF